MKVVYDISVLGLGHYVPKARTGVFRVVENLAYGLAISEECKLSFSTSHSLENVNQVIDYLRAHKKLEHIPLIAPPGFQKDIYRTINDVINRMNDRPKIGLVSKVFQKSLNYTLRLIEKNTQILNLKEFYIQDLFHSPSSPLPKNIEFLKKTKKFLTVYDIMPLLYPELCRLNEDIAAKNVVNSIDPEDWIITVSNFSKHDLCSYRSDIQPSKVFVTYLAASELFYPCHHLETINSIKKKYDIPDMPYVLSLSTLDPRKNVAHTIRCFVKLVEQESIKDINLVLVGVKGSDYNNIFEEISSFTSLKDRIIITGFVADEDLAALYSGAIAFVFPALYEGFGLPPLEAMQCGIPVITSNTSSLPEVVGDAGIMLDPKDTDGLCQSLLDLYNKPSLRQSMSQKSLEQSKKFSWEKCTQETIAAYKMALSS